MIFTYRQLSEVNLPQMVDLDSALFPDDPWNEQMLRAELSSPGSFYAGAFMGEQLVGMAGIRGHFDADIMTVGVLPEMRGRGAAGSLIKMLIEWATQRGWDPIFLEVRATNRAAIRLYEKHGFNQIGRVKNYYRHPLEDAVRMSMTRATK